MAAAGSGAVLEPDQRRGMERSFGRDLRAVRVHTGAAAQRATTALQARAFASGNEIFLGAGESAGDRALMAHELAHVVQQTGPVAAQAPRPVARLARAEALPAARATLPVQRTVSTVQREEGDAWDTVTDAAADLGGAVGEIGEALLAKALDLLPAPVAAAIRDIQAQGILGYLGGLVRKGLGAILGGLADMSPALATAIVAIEDVGARIGAVLGALAGGDCGPLFAAISSLQSAISDAAGAAWDRLAEFFAPVGAFFRNIWNSFGAPTIDWLKQVAQETWDEITGLGQQLWAATGPLRETLGAAFGAAWSGIKRLLGVGEEGESGGGLIGWVSAQANRAWEGIKAQAAPVLEPLGQVVAKVQEVLPLGAIMDLRGTVQGWLDKVSATATSLGQPDTMGSEAGQGSLRDTLLPALNNAISGVQGGAQAAAGWVSGQIGGLAQLVATMLDGIGQNPILGALSGGLSWLRGGVDQLSSWAQAGVGTVFGLVDQGLASLGGFARRALDFLLQLGATLGDLAGRLGDLVVGSLWRAIPACIRDPVVDFLVNQVLRRIPVFSQLLDVPDLWKRVSGLAMTLIRQVFIDGDLAKAAWTFFSAMLNLIGLPPDLVTGIVARAASVLGDILRDPVGFLKNLLQAMKEGISSFLGNALTHLLAGVSGWLFGQAQKAGLTPPADFSLGEVFRFVLDVLGLGTDFIFERLSKATGIAAATLRRGVELAGEALSWISDIVTEGPAALWRHVKDQLSNLWDTVLDAVVSWVSETIVAQAIKKLLTSLDPSGIGAVVNSVIAIYSAIESAVEYLRPMLEIVKSVLDGVGDIARGATAGAAAFVERSMAQAVPVVVGFLANQVGLGDAGHRIAEMVEKLRKRVTAVVDRLIEGAKGLLGKVGSFGKAAAGTLARWLGLTTTFETEDGTTHTLSVEPQGASAEIMLASTAKPLSAHLDDFRAHLGDLEDRAEQAKVRALLRQAEPLARMLEKDARLAAKEKIDSDEWKVIQSRIKGSEAAIRPKLRDIMNVLGIRAPKQIPDPIRVEFDKKSSKAPPPGAKGYDVYLKEYARQLSLQQNAINAMMVEDWLANRAKFEQRGETHGNKRDPASDRAQRDLRERTRMLLIRRLTLPIASKAAVVTMVDADPYLSEFVANVFASFSLTTRKAGLAERTASEQVNLWLAEQAALHSPDQVAGGEFDTLTGLGVQIVNGDIGKNWGKFNKPHHLANNLQKDVQVAMQKLNVRRAFWRLVRMNVVLK
jgi:phage-related protein